MKKFLFILALSIFIIVIVVFLLAHKKDEIIENNTILENSKNIIQYSPQNQTSNIVVVTNTNVSTNNIIGDTTIKMSSPTIYITLDNGTSYDPYEFTTSETLTPEILLAEMAVLTGWNLSLRDSVSIESDEHTISFAENSSFYTGLPENEKKDFKFSTKEKLKSAILKSVQYTIDKNLLDTNIKIVDGN